jgi:hypothetical protein
VPFTEDQTDFDLHVARPRYFGLTPRGLVVAIAVIAFVLGIVGLATGNVAAGVLLIVAAVFLAAVYLEQAKRRRESSLDRVAAAAVDHTRALAGFTGSSVRAWTRAGRELARLRVEASMRARERSQLQYALGGACFSGDEAQVENLREQMHICDREIEERSRRAREVVAAARTRSAEERAAAAETQVMGDPGFEPGTSALSERRSNQLS